MKTWRSASGFLYRALLRCASWLVPAPQREEWSAEWHSELWYVRRSCNCEPAGNSGEMAFCLGAFQDALWVRKNSPVPAIRPFRLESARHCGTFLAILTAGSLILAMLLPSVRSAMLRRPVAGADNLVLISRDRDSGAASSAIAMEEHGPSGTITIGEYQSWKKRVQSLFTDFAFYRPLRNAMASDHGAGGLAVAVASENLFDMLHIPVSATGLEDARSQHLPGLVVSHEAWLRYFGGDAHLAGRVLDVAGQRAVVVAILPDDSLQLSGQMDAWLLESNAYLKALPQDSLGFVVGHVAKAAVTSETRGRWYMTVRNEGASAGFDCVPLYEPVEQQPFITFLYTLMLACLALPATTPLPLGDYPDTDSSLSGATRRRRWVFLLMKVGLAVPIVYCGSMCLAFVNPSMNPASSIYIQFATSFLALLFSFRWALRDQRRRCPVCLRLLTHPARVGHASRSFLAWHGTEFMCGKGHGLLHVPEMATTWFSTQRWLCLDSSWKGLFPEPCLPRTGLS